MPWFVDWLSGSMPLRGADQINAGRIVYLKPSGDVEYTLDRRLQVVGSHGASVQVVGYGDELRFSGNPTKFLQGHNIYGGNRMAPIFTRWAHRIVEQLEASPSADDRDSWERGAVRLTRVDITRMYRPPWAPVGWVPKWLAVASAVAHGGRQRTSNRGMYDANTLYVGANSRRITLKMYDKQAETRRHPLPGSVPAGVREFAADTLRVEVELKGMELKDRRLKAVGAWRDAGIGDEILDERIGKLELHDRLAMSGEELQGMPRRLLLAYHAWRNGTDLRALYASRSWYRLRRDLQAYGVDIANIQPGLNEETEEPPQWALGRPLLDFLAAPLQPPADDPVWELIAA